MPNEGLRWRKLIVNLALGILQASRMDLLSKKGKKQSEHSSKCLGDFFLLNFQTLNAEPKKDQIASEKEKTEKESPWMRDRAEDRLWYLYWVHLCLFLGCVHMIFQVTVCALKYRKIAWLTLRQMQLFTKAWQKGDWTEVSLSLSLLLTHSLTKAWFISTIPKNLKVIFVIRLQAGFAHCFARPHSCKQRRFSDMQTDTKPNLSGLVRGSLELLEAERVGT